VTRSSQEPAEAVSAFRVAVSWNQGGRSFTRWVDVPADQLGAWAAWRATCREPHAYSRGARGAVAGVTVELIEWRDGRSHVRARFPGPEPTEEGGNPPLVSPARIRSTIEALGRQKVGDDADPCDAGCGREATNYDPTGRPWCDEHRDGRIVLEPEQGEML